MNILPIVLHLIQFSNDMEIQYIGCLLIANLISDQQLSIESSLLIISQTMITDFMKNYTPKMVREIEERKRYIWVSIKPFVELIYSGFPVVKQLGMFSLANLTCHAPNRFLLMNNGDFKDDIIAAAYCMKDISYGLTILENFGFKYVPKLSSLIRIQYPEYNNYQ